MSDVVEDVLRTIGGVSRQDPLAEKVAKKVIELAQAGDCDCLRLKELALKAFEEHRIRKLAPALARAASLTPVEPAVQHRLDMSVARNGAGLS